MKSNTIKQLRALRVMACAMRDKETVGINSIIRFQLESSLTIGTCSIFGGATQFQTSIDYGTNAVKVINELLKQIK